MPFLKGIRKNISDLPEDLRDRFVEAVAASLDELDEYEIVIPEIRIQIRKKVES